MQTELSGNTVIEKIISYKWLILIFAALLPYLAGISGDFVFDDGPLIKDDSFYQLEKNPLKCWTRSFWKESRRQGLYRPFTVFSYWLNAGISGIYSPGFRAGNLVLHLIITLLIYKLALRLRFGSFGAILTAILFAVHPIHSEAVVPAFGRAELLCALFLIAGLIFHSYVKDSKNPVSAVAGAGLCFILACWSKEHAIIFIPLCLIQDLYLKKGFLRRRPFIFRRIRPYLVYFCVFAAAVYSRYLVLGTIVPAKDRFAPLIDNRLALSPLLIREISAIRLQGLALLKFFWPKTLSHDYSYAQLLPAESVFDIYAWLTILLFCGITAGAYYYFPRDRRKILFLAGAYAVSVIPAGNFFIPAGTIFAERLHYISSLWLCFALGLFFSRLSRRFPFYPVMVIFISVIAAASARTYLRSLDWDTRLSIALSGIKTAPRSVKSWNNLAVQFEAEKEYEQAVLACDEALDIYPDYTTAIANRASYYAGLGHYKKAEAEFRRVLVKEPGNIQANFNLGALLANTGRLEEAKEVWERLLSYDPDQPALRQELKKLYKEMKKK